MSRPFLAVWLACALFAMGLFALQQPLTQPRVKYVPQAQVKTEELTFLPSCARVAALRGDPNKEAAILYAEVTRGCVVPWHWHTPIEDLAMVGGTARIEMKDSSPRTVNAGDFISFPPKHIHQFTCVRTCSFYLVSSGPFDVHYVDASGAEIPIAKALKNPGRPARVPAPPKP
jgi:quercetin dioxygenase-like cupin family protein